MSKFLSDEWAADVTAALNSHEGFKNAIGDADLARIQLDLLECGGAQVQLNRGQGGIGLPGGIVDTTDVAQRPWAQFLLDPVPRTERAGQVCREIAAHGRWRAMARGAGFTTVRSSRESLRKHRPRCDLRPPGIRSEGPGAAPGPSRGRAGGQLACASASA